MIKYTYDHVFGWSLQDVKNQKEEQESKYLWEKLKLIKKMQKVEPNINTNHKYIAGGDEGNPN